MNDDLIVRISVNSSIFISIWMSLTDNFNQKRATRSTELCLGYFSETSITIDWEKMTQPKETRLLKFLPLKKILSTLPKAKIPILIPLPPSSEKTSFMGGPSGK